MNGTALVLKLLIDNALSVDICDGSCFFLTRFAVDFPRHPQIIDIFHVAAVGQLLNCVYCVIVKSDMTLVSPLSF